MGLTYSFAQSVPSWFSALGHKEWATPVSNWLGASGVKDPLADTTNNGSTGHASIITAYCGMGCDQDNKQLFMLHNGGHGDYYGNEVYSCDLSVASPAWIRRRNATAASGSGSLTKWADGRPVSDHTTCLHVAAEGRWFTPGMASTNYAGDCGSAQWWEYDRGTEDYIDLGSGHAAFSPSTSGLGLYDSADRQIISVLRDNLTSNISIEFQDLDDMSGSPALTNTEYLNLASGPVGAIDTTNRVLLVRGGTSYYFVRLDSAANKQAAWSSVSASGTPPDSAYQFYWHEPSEAFITWDGSGGIKKLTPTVSGGAYTALAWSDVTGNGGDDPSGVTPATYMYDKINYIADMGDGAAALIVVPEYADPDVYVMRIEGAI